MDILSSKYLNDIGIFLLQVDSDNPAFPRSTAFWWLGCSSAPRGTVGGNARLSANDETISDDDVGDIQFDAGRRTPRTRGKTIT